MYKTNKFLAHLENAFFKACSLDVKVLKPGNVSFQSPGHGMQAIQFINSLKVVTPILFDQKKTIGEKIEHSVYASFETVGCNTNLGIILLCAPIVEALLLTTKNLCSEEIHNEQTLGKTQESLKNIIVNTTLADSKAVFRAIKKANPGGLGSSDFADVKLEPKISILNAMRAGAQKDFIAKQYCIFFQDIFDHEIIQTINKNNAEKIIQNVNSKKNLEKFVQKIYFSWLISHQDTHIVRKFGVNLAKKIKNEACDLLSGESSMLADSKIKNVDIELPSEKEILNWDYSLKMRKINPGTSADLTVCTLFLAYVFMPNLKYF